MHIIDGKALAARIKHDLVSEVRALAKVPRLNVLLVGNDAASRLYVNLKKQAGVETGIQVHVEEKPATSSQAELEAIIDAWNQDPAVNAILIQLPLPINFDTHALINRIALTKDADGFHPNNPNPLSPLHEGILRLISQTPLRLAGAQGVIVANSEIFANPLKHILQTGGVSVDVMHPDELNKSRMQEADLIISAVGRPEYLPASWVKDNAVLIDVGTTKVDGKTIGDFERSSIENTDCWLTPVPGGVGPMTVALLLKNVYQLTKQSSSRVAV